MSERAKRGEVMHSAGGTGGAAPPGRMDWFDQMAAELAAASGLEVTELGFPLHIRDEILDLARIASHDSGERINAPLLCYALGIAVGKGASLESLAATIRAREND